MKVVIPSSQKSWIGLHCVQVASSAISKAQAGRFESYRQGIPDQGYNQWSLLLSSKPG